MVGNLFLLTYLLTGLAMLMVAVVVLKDKKQRLKRAVVHSILWGAGYVFSAGIEVLLFASI